MEIVFIIGVGRSGTSLLQSMLNAHSEIAFLPETQFLRKYVLSKTKWLDASEMVRLLLQDEKFARLPFTEEEVVDGCNNFLEVYDRILYLYLVKKNKLLIGDKDPRNMDFVPKLVAKFPECKLIHIIRDPRSVVYSRTKANWSKHWPLFLHVFLYHAQMKMINDEKRHLDETKYFEFRYEDLIHTPIEKLETISDFLNIEFENNMLFFSDSAKELVDKTEMQWKKETIGPLLSNNDIKWKDSLNAFDVALIESICKEEMNTYYYQRSNPDVGFINKLTIGVLKLSSKIFTKIYPLRIKFL